MYRTRWALTILVLLVVVSAQRAAVGQAVRHDIHFPDLPGYQTLACDLHMHTVFSDGNVWPPVRVAEGWRQGLDVIAITDHIEYQPHRDDVPTNHNRPYDLAREAALAHGMLLIKGAEITRDTPPGHFNAIFLDDVDPLDTPDFETVFTRARDQGAFVFWNHQGWKGPERGRWMDIHTTIYEKGLLHGMEVCNGDTYYPEAHKWCLEKNLTMLGTTDIHDPDLRLRSTAADHRTMTLVFAKEKSPQALKEALMEGRTAVWYMDQIIGRKELLEPLFHGCVQIQPPHHRSGKTIWLHVRNVCDTDMRLQRTGSVGPAELLLPARATSLVKLGVGDPNQRVKLEYTATNFLVAPGEGLAVVLEIPAP